MVPPTAMRTYHHHLGFDGAETRSSERNPSHMDRPLATRMRPRNFKEFVGHHHLLGEGKPLTKLIDGGHLPSTILWGPPGTGKTTLAHLLAVAVGADFQQLSAVSSGVSDARRVMDHSKTTLFRTVLFVDEVHRWNKAQQDALLPHVETGAIILIGATTENPYFEVIGALVSRSRIFQLRPLNDENVRHILEQALGDAERGYGNRITEIDEDAMQHLIHVAGGDARNALNALELAVESTPVSKDKTIHVTLQVAQESIQRRAVLYDKDGDAHYDTISAFIKSVRGSDPDAALYWLAKMLYAGEDPRFILRRLLILAGEDIGLGDPMGLVVANAAAQSFDYVGLPEGIYPIVHATLYLSTAPKSNTAGSYFAAYQKIEADGLVDVPDALKDKNRDAKALGHGKGYVYPHDEAEHFAPQQYLPKAVLGTYFYTPSEQGYEAAVKERLTRWREAQRKALGILRTEEVPALDQTTIEELKRRHKAGGSA